MALLGSLFIVFGPKKLSFTAVTENLALASELSGFNYKILNLLLLNSYFLSPQCVSAAAFEISHCIQGKSLQNIQAKVIHIFLNFNSSLFGS